MLHMNIPLKVLSSAKKYYQVSFWIPQVYRKHRRPRRFNNWERGVKEVEAHTNDISRESNVLWDNVTTQIKIFSVTHIHHQVRQSYQWLLVKIDQRHLRWQPFVKADITLKELTLSSTLWLHVWKWDGEPELHRNNSTHSQRPKERILSYNSPAYMQSYYTRVYIYVLIPQSTILKTASQKIQHRSCHILFTCILLLMSKNRINLCWTAKAKLHFSCRLLDGIIRLYWENSQTLSVSWSMLIACFEKYTVRFSWAQLAFLAVHNSSIGDLVSHSTFTFDI